LSPPKHVQPVPRKAIPDDCEQSDKDFTTLRSMPQIQQPNFYIIIIIYVIYFSELLLTKRRNNG